MDKDDLYLALIIVGVPFVAALAGLIFRAFRRRRGSKSRGDWADGAFDDDGGGDGGNGD